ncbi:MAG: rhomboid family intramembrane serine protease [Tannerella sp.]|jgi:membrane associated rhomboid family serine protease|nr:rhomboid family intramembrane serine protease [Tannerella sp.]
MKYTLPLIWIIFFIIFDNKELGYSNTSPIYTHITYIFAHAGLMHLLLNSLSFIYVYQGLKHYNLTRQSLIISFVIGIAASFLSAYDTPTVGASGMIFAMLGCYITTAGFTNQQMRRILVTIFLSLTIPMLIPGINYKIHILSFTAGLTVTYIADQIKTKCKQKEGIIRK